MPDGTNKIWYDPFGGSLSTGKAVAPITTEGPQPGLWDIWQDGFGICRVPSGTPLQGNYVLYLQGVTLAQIILTPGGNEVPAGNIVVCQIVPGGAPPGPAPAPASGGLCFNDAGVVTPVPIGGAVAGLKVFPCPPPKPTAGQPGTGSGASCDDPIYVKICSPESQPAQPQQTQPGQPFTPAPITAPSDVQLDTVSTCNQIDTWAKQYQGQSPQGILQAAGVVDQTGHFGWITSASNSVSGWAIVGDGLSQLIQAAGDVLALPIQAWMSIQNTIASLACDNAGAMSQLANMRGPLTWIRRLLGIETKPIETIITHWENYLCPVNVPSSLDADIARRTGDISKDEWRCWVRLNGLNETVHEHVYNSRRLQLSPQELIALWRRQEITDQDIPNLLAQAGMISTDDQIRLAKVTEFIPPVTDLIRFTARALGDQDLVQRFRLLEGFDTLYQGKLKDWGQANGISDEVMQYYFAGTRQIPAPGQLYTMLQRLRSDNVPAGIDPADWTTTTDDLDRALREQHYSPFWWSRLKAISYIPLGLRQLRRPYVEGIIQNDQLLPRLKDLGYSEQDARFYLLALGIERIDTIRKHPIIKLYIDAAISKQEATSRLVQLGYQEQEAADAVSWGSQEFLDKSRLLCVQGLKKRYECGEFDSGQIEEQLSGIGLDNDQVVTLRVRWDCERKSCGKQVAAAQLCSWADSGLITPDEHKRRLKNAGYSDVDASNIVAECNLKQEQRVLSQRERAAKALAQQLQKQADRKKSSDRQALAAANKAARDLRTLQRQAATDQARAVRAMASATDRANRVRAAMFRTAASQAGKMRVKEVMLAKAAETWALTAGIDLSTAASQISDALRSVQSLDGLGADLAIRSVVMAALAAKKAKTVDLIQAATDLAHAMLDYAAVASAAVCEPTNGGCEAPQSNGSNAVQASTNEGLPHAVALSSADTSSRIVGT